MADYLATSEILARLSAERDALVERLAKIPAALQNERPSPERWSIAEVLEHLVRIETGVAKLFMMKGQTPPPDDVPVPAPEASSTPALGKRIRDRSQRIEAPERVRPAGTLSAESALTQLQAARAGLLSAFASANADALDRVTHAHPVFGPLTLRSWMALTSDHEARHAAQIDEIAGALRAR